MNFQEIKELLILKKNIMPDKPKKPINKFAPDEARVDKITTDLNFKTREKFANEFIPYNKANKIAGYYLGKLAYYMAMVEKMQKRINELEKK